MDEVAKEATKKCYQCKWIERESDNIAKCYCDCMTAVIEDIDWDDWKEELEEEGGLCPEFQEG